MILLTLFGSFRIGEASNPGPHFEADVFTLGAFNPSGLRNKAHYFQTHMSDGDIWTVLKPTFTARMFHVSEQDCVPPNLLTGIVSLTSHP